MKRLVIGAACAGLCVSGLSAEAAAKPVPMTYFMHGIAAVDEAASNIATGEFMTLDATPPSGSQSKSKQVTNYVGGPNTECAGNSLFPTFVGKLSGDVTGEMKISFTSMAPPGSSINIQVFADTEAQACNDEFPKIAGSATVALPAGMGKTEAVIKGVKLKSKASFMVHFAPLSLSPTSQARIFYDSSSDNSSVSFACTPKPGKKAC